MSGADDADRLARVKLSSAIEPGDLRVTGLVSALGAAKVLDYLEAAGDVENHWGFTIGQEFAHADPAKLLEQADMAGIRFIIPGDPSGQTASRAFAAPARCTSEAENRSACGSAEDTTCGSSPAPPWLWSGRVPRPTTAPSKPPS